MTIYSFASSRRILFNKIERLVFDSADDESRDDFDAFCDDETRDEALTNREKNASIMIKMREKFNLQIQRSSDEDDCWFENLINKKY